jgi:tetratricopeptide (TPR) repeat protein
VLLGIVLCEAGRWDEGGDQFRGALQADPASDWALNELAWLLATAPDPALRDASEAVRLAEQAVAAVPKSGNYRNTLGAARYRQGDDQGAVADLTESMRLRHGGDSWDWFFLAMARWRLGDRDAARCWLGRAVTWMERYLPHDEQLRRFRAEAEALLSGTGMP